MFSIGFSALLFFQCFFDYSDRINREFITKSIKSNNCEETSLPLKRRNIVLIIVAVKLLPLQPYDRTYFSLKTANVCIFSTVNRKLKFFSAVSPIFGPSRKPQTLFMIPKWSTATPIYV